jgi:hypothetical protein
MTDQNTVPDYAAMLAEVRAHPPKIDSPQSLAADLRAIHAKELARISAMGPDAGAILMAEKEAAASSFRRQQESAGAEKTRLETEAMTRRLEELRLQQAAAVEASLSVDPETNEKCTALELAARNHNRAMARIANRVVTPLTESGGVAELERQQSIRDRFTAAAAESRKPDLASEKY